MKNADLRRDLVARVERNLLEQRLVPRQGRLLVAVSGGLDSTVLLRVLSHLAPKFGLSLGVAHLDHGLRGEDSRADARRVKYMSRRLGFPCFSERARVAEAARRENVSIEMAARHARHEFLARTARRERCPAIALAHHADDQVELFFLRLLRGSGLEGLAGMKWSAPSPTNPKVRLVRPLLNIARQELEAYATAEALSWSEDATNAELDFLRNRIRHELLPLLRRKYQPGLDACVLRTRAILAADAEFVAEEAQAWLRNLADGTSARDFESLPLALQRQSVRLQLLQAGWAGDFDLVEDLRMRPGRRVEIAPAVFASRDGQGRVTVHANEPKLPLNFGAGSIEVDLEPGEGECRFGGLIVRWRVAPGKGIGKLPLDGGEVFDAEAVGPRITLRHWKPGDRFWPIGGPGPAKLQDLLTNEKVPSAEKRRIVLACDAKGDVFWVEKLRIAERFKLTRHTRKYLYWRWDRA